MPRTDPGRPVGTAPTGIAPVGIAPVGTAARGSLDETIPTTDAGTPVGGATGRAGAAGSLDVTVPATERGTPVGAAGAAGAIAMRPFPERRGAFEEVDSVSVEEAVLEVASDVIVAVAEAVEVGTVDEDSASKLIPAPLAAPFTTSVGLTGSEPITPVGAATGAAGSFDETIPTTDAGRPVGRATGGAGSFDVTVPATERGTPVGAMPRIEAGRPVGGATGAAGSLDVTVPATERGTPVGGEGGEGGAGVSSWLNWTLEP